MLGRCYSVKKAYALALVHHGILPVVDQSKQAKRIGFMNNWRELIPGCFGVGDRLFASQHCDIQRAREMLIAALLQGVGYKEFCTAIKDWLHGQLVNANAQIAKERLKTEMRKVRKLSTYFRA